MHAVPYRWVRTNRQCDKQGGHWAAWRVWIARLETMGWGVRRRCGRALDEVLSHWCARCWWVRNTFLLLGALSLYLQRHRPFWGHSCALVVGWQICRLEKAYNCSRKSARNLNLVERFRVLRFLRWLHLLVQEVVLREPQELGKRKPRNPKKLRMFLLDSTIVDLPMHHPWTCGNEVFVRVLHFHNKKFLANRR